LGGLERFPERYTARVALTQVVLFSVCFVFFCYALCCVRLLYLFFFSSFWCVSFFSVCLGFLFLFFSFLFFSGNSLLFRLFSNLLFSYPAPVVCPFRCRSLYFGVCEGAASNGCATGFPFCTLETLRQCACVDFRELACLVGRGLLGAGWGAFSFSCWGQSGAMCDDAARVVICCRRQYPVWPMAACRYPETSAMSIVPFQSSALAFPVSVSSALASCIDAPRGWGCRLAKPVSVSSVSFAAAPSVLGSGCGPRGLR